MAQRTSVDRRVVDDEDPGVTDSRLSLLAVAALALSLPCFVPGAGALAVIIAVVALIVIGRSRGARRGRPAAIIGMSLGVISTAIWVSIGLWATRFSAFYQDVVTVRAASFVEPGAGGWDAARAFMTTEAGAATSDADFEQFGAAIRAHYGAFVEAPVNWGSAWETFADSIERSGNASPRGSPDSIPAPIRCANGSTSVFVVFVKSTWMTDEFKIVDAFALLPDRNVVTLRKNGPAKDEALTIGFAPHHGVQALPNVEEPAAEGDGIGGGG